MAAETLARGGRGVTVFDRMPSPGRKFLLAGRGGLNLTHSEELERFLSRYGEGAPRLRAAIEAFPPSALRAWCEGLGQDTFVGTSGRVFPQGDESVAAASGLARAAGGAEGARSSRAIAGPDGTPTAARVRDAGRARRGYGRCHGPRAGRRELAPAWLGRALDRAFRQAAIAISPAEAVQLRLCGGFLRSVPRPLRGPAAEGHRAAFRRAKACAARPSLPRPGSKAARSMRCPPLLRDAIERDGRGGAGARSAPGPPCGRVGGRACQAARQAIVVERSCARRSSFRPLPRACCKRPRSAGVPLASMDAAALAALIKAFPSASRQRPASSGPFRPPAASRSTRWTGASCCAAARRLRRRRDAGLGGADRRLSAASLLLHRRGRCTRRNGVARGPFYRAGSRPGRDHDRDRVFVPLRGWR